MKRSVPLCVDRLEDRCVPAAKPFSFGGVVPPPFQSGPIVVQIRGPVMPDRSVVEFVGRFVEHRENFRSNADDFFERGRSRRADDFAERAREHRGREDRGDDDTSFVIDVFPVDPNVPAPPSSPPPSGSTDPVPPPASPPTGSTIPPIAPPIPGV